MAGAAAVSDPVSLTDSGKRCEQGGQPMTSTKPWRCSLIVVGLPLVLGSPQRSWAEGPAHPPTSAQTAPRPLAKPLSREDGEAVRAHVGKRCRLTFLDGGTREGVVVQVQPGAWIKLEVPAGAPETLSWKYIAAVSPVELAANDEQSPPPAGPEPAQADSAPPPLALATSPPESSAQASSPPPSGPPNPAMAVRPSAECIVRTPYCRILLQDGQTVLGRVVDIRPGQSWTVRSTTGNTRELAWSAVQSTEAIPAPVPGTTAESSKTPLPSGAVVVDVRSDRPVSLWALPEGKEPQVLFAARTHQWIMAPRVHEYRIAGHKIPSVEFELGPDPRYRVTVQTGNSDQKDGGIAMLSIGAAGVFASLSIVLVAGLAVAARGLASNADRCKYTAFDPASCKGPDNSDLTPSLGAAAALLGVGGALVGGGIALLVKGRTRIAVESVERLPPEDGK